MTLTMSECHIHRIFSSTRDAIGTLITGIISALIESNLEAINFFSWLIYQIADALSTDKRAHEAILTRN